MKNTKIKILEEELEILHYFFTWDLDWLRERKEKGLKFTNENSQFILTSNFDVQLIDR